MSYRGHLLFLILLPFLAGAGADDTEEEIISEMVGQRHSSSNPGPGSQTEIHGLRSSQLPPSLLLKLLRAEVLSNKDTLISDVFDDNDNKSINNLNNSENREGADSDGLVKRVFCNGFTGCGGRHRDRSRRQGKRLIPVLVKRPFCNSFGCYNLGKRATRPFSGFRMAPSMRARVLADTLRTAEGLSKGMGPAAEETGMGPLPSGLPAGIPGLPGLPAGLQRLRAAPPVRLPAPGKRLFCNNFGGCRGYKRSLYSNWLSKMNSVADGRRRRR